MRFKIKFKICYICGKRFQKKFLHDKNYQEVRDHCHYTGKDKVNHIVFVI